MTRRIAAVKRLLREEGPWAFGIILLEVWSRFQSRTYYAFRFGSLGAKSTVRKPIMIRGGKWIHIGRSTHIRDGARLEVIQRPCEKPPLLRIGSNVLIEQDVHIVCSGSMIIGDNVAIAARCVIVDTTHPLPVPGDHNVGHTLMPGDASVSIGAGTMLGAGAVVLANVTIGERCVVGANAVVTRDVPADTVVVGVPARPQRTSVH